MPKSPSKDLHIPTPSPLKEGVHFYIDARGLMVFTEAYHLERGSCCKNGCRHCPWNFRV